MGLALAVIVGERLLRLPALLMKRNIFPMSLSNTKPILDLSRADGNILVDQKIIKSVTLSPSSLASLPSRDKYLELKKSIAQYYDFQPDGVVIGNGSDELIDSIAREVDGGTSLTLVPTFERLFEVSEKFGHKHELFSLRLSDEFRYTDTFHEDFILKVKEFSPDIVWLCSPNNPTGSVISVGQLSDIARAAKNGLVVIDVAFADIVDGSLVSQYAALIASHENIIILNSFSKSWGMSGLRLGFILASKHKANLIARHSVVFNVNSVALEVALLCLEDDGYKTESFSNIEKNRKKILSNISKLDKYQVIMNEPLNIVCIRHKTKQNLHENLLELGIKTKSLNKMPGMENKGFCRVLVPATDSDTDKLLRALESIS